MPIITQIFLPSVITIITFVTTIFQTTPVHNLHPIHPEKRVLSAHISPTITPEEKNIKKDNYEKIIITHAPTATPSPTGSISNSTPTPTISSANPMITAHSTISANGKTINLTMQYAKNGGAITGNISGDCKGSINGTFNANTSTLSGSAKATCSMGFISIPVSISFSGNLINSSQAEIHYNVSAAGQSDSGDTTLFLK